MPIRQRHAYVTCDTYQLHASYHILFTSTAFMRHDSLHRLGLVYDDSTRDVTSCLHTVFRFLTSPSCTACASLPFNLSSLHREQWFIASSVANRDASRRRRRHRGTGNQSDSCQAVSGYHSSSGFIMGTAILPMDAAILVPVAILDQHRISIYQWISKLIWNKLFYLKMVSMK